jgi:hypothetical protein
VVVLVSRGVLHRTLAVRVDQVAAVSALALLAERGRLGRALPVGLRGLAILAVSLRTQAAGVAAAQALLAVTASLMASVATAALVYRHPSAEQPCPMLAGVAAVRKLALVPRAAQVVAGVAVLKMLPALLARPIGVVVVVVVAEALPHRVVAQAVPASSSSAIGFNRCPFH